MDEEMDNEHKAVKATITYADGHTEDCEVFVVVAVTGLTCAGVSKDKLPYWMPGKEMHCRSMCCVCGTVDVVGAVLQTMGETMRQIVDSSIEAGGVEVALQLLRVMEATGMARQSGHSSTEVKQIRPEDN